MTFKDFKLHNLLQIGLQDIGFTTPTAIQQRSIPVILEGKDVLGAAQTGTGKTGAFIIPVLNRILEHPSEGTKVLILSPTRELAQQIDEQIFAFGYHTGISSATIIGGEDFAKQAEAIRAGVDIIVVTPGRLIDQMKVLDVDFSHIKFLVLDEADRMLDMGFLPDVNHIIDKLPKNRQTLLFSATIPKEIQKLAKAIQNNPEFVQIKVSKPSISVNQRAYQVDGREKLKLTQYLLDELEWSSCIIFTATKRGTDQLEGLLVKKGIQVASIHGDRDQSERTKALNDFKNGIVPIIVATDVLARGIDIADISLIINYDVPKALEDYIHRIGRTGRYDKTGMAVTLVSKKDARLFKAIRDKVGNDLSIIDGDALIKAGVPQKQASIKTKEKIEPKKNKQDSKSKPKQSRIKVEPDFSKAKSIKIATMEDGKLSIELLNKFVSKERSNQHSAKKIPSKQKNKNTTRDSKSSSRDKNHRSSKKNKAPKKPSIELKKINRAVERNKKSRKPAKGLWGLIKSMLPKF